MSARLSVKVFERKDGFIPFCPELDVYCYGSTRENATSRLKEVILFYLESAREIRLTRKETNEPQKQERGNPPPSSPPTTRIPTSTNHPSRPLEKNLLKSLDPVRNFCYYQ